MINIIYVDPILWLFYGAVLASLAWLAVCMIVAHVYRNKGREDVLTASSRRQGKGELSGADINMGEFIKNISENRPKVTVSKPKPSLSKK